MIDERMEPERDKISIFLAPILGFWASFMKIGFEKHCRRLNHEPKKPPSKMLSTDITAVFEFEFILVVLSISGALRT